MPDHNAILRWMQDQHGPKLRERADQAKTRAEVGRRAQMISEHPGFELWIAHLDEMRAAVQRSRDGKARLMVEGDSLGEALVKLKLDIARLDGELKALGQAVELIPELIRRGQEAAKFTK